MAEIRYNVFRLAQQAWRTQVEVHRKWRTFAMQEMQDMIDRLNQSGKRLSKGHRKIAQYIV